MVDKILIEGIFAFALKTKFQRWYTTLKKAVISNCSIR